MFEKKIEFIATNNEMVDVWPHPKPSTHFVPEEYKKLHRYEKNNFHEPTVKTCIPFLDSLTAGYIIPFDQDYVVDPVEEDFSVTAANKQQGGVGFHDGIQLPPEWSKNAVKKAGKFINKWLIKTPPGYSCLFIHPMNRSEDRWKIIEGVVDTDSYINVINFPFILNERNKQFMIKKGDPMVQVIPFKRESWKMWSGFYIEKKHKATLDLLSSKWVDRYKTMFWKKKNFR